VPSSAPRYQPAEQRRHDLLAAGRELFMAKGITGTTLAEITRGAGVSKGLFYQYFRSKEDLVAALQEQFSADLAARVRDAVAAQEDWGARLDACVQASYDGYRELGALHEVLFRHPHAGHRHGHAEPGHWHVAHEHGPAGDAPVPPGWHEPAAHEPPLAGAVRELLAAGAAAGAFTVPDPEATAALLFAILHAFDPGVHDSGLLPAARLVAATRELFRRAAGWPG
jgi:AcrR family transcriptional regulator